MRLHPRSPATIMASNRGGWRILRTRVALLQPAQWALDAALPEIARGHVHVADYSDHRLLLIADSGAWATRLRYQQDAIRRSFAGRLRSDVADISIRVRPANPNPPALPVQPRVLSETTRRLLAACAEQADDPALAQALRRLSRSGRS